MTRRAKALQPRESWFASSNHDRVAAALMQCEHGDPQRCWQDAECHSEENCFSPIAPSLKDRVRALEERLAKIEAAAKKEAR